MVLGRQPFISDNPGDAIQMHLFATPPRPSILWKGIPLGLESLLLKLLAKNPAERATLAEVREALAALRPMATQSLDRVDAAAAGGAAAAAAPAPGTRGAPGGRRGDLLALAFAGYRPSKLRAEQAAAAAKAASVAAKEPPARPAAALRPRQRRCRSRRLHRRLAAPAAHPATHRAKRSRRDANDLLDPFARYFAPDALECKRDSRLRPASSCLSTRRMAKNEQEDDFVPLPLATDLSAGTVVGEYRSIASSATVEWPRSTAPRIR